MPKQFGQGEIIHHIHFYSVQTEIATIPGAAAAAAATTAAAFMEIATVPIITIIV